MKNLEELFYKEFKNLYALEKQINEVLPSLNCTQSKKLSKYFDKFSKRSALDYESIHNYIQELSINPGNTTDSVAIEMLDNLKEIDGQDLDASIKEAGFLASINRLVRYKSTNYFNVYRMAKVLERKKIMKGIRKMKDKNQRLEKKFRKLTKKKIFKNAIKQ